MQLQRKLEIEIEKLKFKTINDKHVAMIDVIIDTLRNIDKELNPLLDSYLGLIHITTDNKTKMYFLVKLLEFYGLDSYDILACRQKYKSVENKLVKEMFLTEGQRNSIKTILNEMNIFGA